MTSISQYEPMKPNVMTKLSLLCVNVICAVKVAEFVLNIMSIKIHKNEIC